MHSCRAQAALDVFSHPFTVQGTKLHATTRIGVAVFPVDGSETERCMKRLLREDKLRVSKYRAGWRAA